MAAEPITPCVLLVGETDVYTMNFGNRFAYPPTGEMISGTPAVAGGGLTVGSVTVTGYKVRFTLAGAAADTDYNVTVTALTTGGRTLVGVGPILGRTS